jgi:hypothetical protein
MVRLPHLVLPELPAAANDAASWRTLRQSETSGRPLGSAAGLPDLEARTGRALAPRKREPKPRGEARQSSKLAPQWLSRYRGR